MRNPGAAAAGTSQDTSAETTSSTVATDTGENSNGNTAPEGSTHPATGRFPQAPPLDMTDEALGDPFSGKRIRGVKRPRKAGRQAANAGKTNDNGAKDNNGRSSENVNNNMEEDEDDLGREGGKHTSGGTTIPSAPVLHPSEEEFADALGYLTRIATTHSKYGMVKIVPPKSWEQDFSFDTKNFWFQPRIQEMNLIDGRSRMEARYMDQLKRFHTQEGRPINKIPSIDKSPIRFLKLRDLVISNGGHEAVTSNRLWATIVRSLKIDHINNITNASNTCKQAYIRWILPYEQWLINNRRGARTELSKVEKIEQQSNLDLVQQSKENSSQATSTETSQTQSSSQSVPLLGNKDTCQLCYTVGDDEMLLCDDCNLGYHFHCLNPEIQIAPNVPEWYCPPCLGKLMGDYGFVDGRYSSLEGFRKFANHFKDQYFKTKYDKIDDSTVLKDEDIEAEFLSIIDNPFEEIDVEYGADLHTTIHGSGFPTVETAPLDPMSRCVWNLNNIGILPDSLLSYVKNDISGMMSPWLYIGMVFSTFCWHVEDHNMYSINYNHLGAKKTWYSIPSYHSKKFEKVAMNLLSDMYKENNKFLFDITTFINPYTLVKEGVDVYAMEQSENEFVVTFPQAYHAGFNHGFNFCEAVNFALQDWVPYGSEAADKYLLFRKTPVFSHEMLLMTCIPRLIQKNKSVTKLYPEIARILEREDRARKEILNKFPKIIKIDGKEVNLDVDSVNCSECERWCGFSCVYDLHTQLMSCSLHAPQMVAWILDGGEPNLTKESITKDRLRLVEVIGLEDLKKVKSDSEAYIKKTEDDSQNDKVEKESNGTSTSSSTLTPMDIVSEDQVTPDIFKLPSGILAPIARPKKFILKSDMITEVKDSRQEANDEIKKLIYNAELDHTRKDNNERYYDDYYVKKETTTSALGTRRNAASTATTRSTSRATSPGESVTSQSNQISPPKSRRRPGRPPKNKSIPPQDVQPAKAERTVNDHGDNLESKTRRGKGIKRTNHGYSEGEEPDLNTTKRRNKSSSIEPKAEPSIDGTNETGESGGDLAATTEQTPLGSTIALDMNVFMENMERNTTSSRDGSVNTSADQHAAVHPPPRKRGRPRRVPSNPPGSTGRNSINSKASGEIYRKDEFWVTYCDAVKRSGGKISLVGAKKLLVEYGSSKDEYYQIISDVVSDMNVVLATLKDSEYEPVSYTSFPGMPMREKKLSCSLVKYTLESCGHHQIHIPEKESILNLIAYTNTLRDQIHDYVSESRYPVVTDLPLLISKVMKSPFSISGVSSFIVKIFEDPSVRRNLNSILSSRGQIYVTFDQLRELLDTLKIMTPDNPIFRELYALYAASDAWDKDSIWVMNNKNPLSYLTEFVNKGRTVCRRPHTERQLDFYVTMGMQVRIDIIEMVMKYNRRGNYLNDEQLLELAQNVRLIPNVVLKLHQIWLKPALRNYHSVCESIVGILQPFGMWVLDVDCCPQKVSQPLSPDYDAMIRTLEDDLQTPRVGEILCEQVKNVKFSLSKGTTGCLCGKSEHLDEIYKCEECLHEYHISCLKEFYPGNEEHKCPVCNNYSPLTKLKRVVWQPFVNMLNESSYSGYLWTTYMPLHEVEINVHTILDPIYDVFEKFVKQSKDEEDEKEGEEGVKSSESTTGNNTLTFLEVANLLFRALALPLHSPEMIVFLKSVLAEFKIDENENNVEESGTRKRKYKTSIEFDPSGPADKWTPPLLSKPKVLPKPLNIHECCDCNTVLDQIEGNEIILNYRMGDIICRKCFDEVYVFETRPREHADHSGSQHIPAKSGPPLPPPKGDVLY